MQRTEIARSLAQRLLKSKPNDQQRMDLLFQLLASRKPTKIERAACLNLLQQMTERFNKAKQDAEAFLKVGDSPRDESLPAVQLAAWTQVAVTVLASDIAITLY